MLPNDDVAVSLMEGLLADVGRIVGHIDTIRFEGEHCYIRGWAGQQGIKDSIKVHVYADHSGLMGRVAQALHLVARDLS